VFFKTKRIGTRACLGAKGISKETAKKDIHSNHNSKNKERKKKDQHLIGTKHILMM
jgi:hypothetical protein